MKELLKRECHSAGLTGSPKIHIFPCVYHTMRITAKLYRHTQMVQINHEANRNSAHGGHKCKVLSSTGVLLTSKETREVIKRNIT